MSSAAAAVEAIKAGELEKLRLLVDAEPAFHRARRERCELGNASRYYRRPEAAEALLIASRPLDIWEAAALESEEVIQQLCRQQPELIHAWSPDGFNRCIWRRSRPAHGRAGLSNLKIDVNAAAHNPMSVCQFTVPWPAAITTSCGC